jgi:hypothetical protein
MDGYGWSNNNVGCVYIVSYVWIGLLRMEMSQEEREVFKEMGI